MAQVWRNLVAGDPGYSGRTSLSMKPCIFLLV